MFVALLLLSSLSAALACAPGSTTGKAYTTATYDFTILPPLSWSSSKTAAAADPAQKANATAALDQVNLDVTNAIQATLIENNIPMSSVSINITYTPEETTVIQTAACAATGDYVPYKGSLYYKCNVAQAAMVDSKGSILLTSTTAITADQWRSLAVGVQNRLALMHVIFSENLVVSYA